MNIPNIANQKVVGFDHFKFRVNNNAFGNAPHETIVKRAFPPNPPQLFQQMDTCAPPAPRISGKVAAGGESEESVASTVGPVEAWGQTPPLWGETPPSLHFSWAVSRFLQLIALQASLRWRKPCRETGDESAVTTTISSRQIQIRRA